jgi:histone deacetylase HOS3
MQRHGKRVPTSFYSRFATDVRALAATHAASRLVAILEGGYADRALASGVASLLDGFVADHGTLPGWDAKTLGLLERACDPATSHRTRGEPWLATAQAVFSVIEGVQLPSVAQTGGPSTAPATPTPMALRERKAKVFPGEVETPPNPAAARRGGRAVSVAATRKPKREDETPPLPPAPSIAPDVAPLTLTVRPPTADSDGEKAPPKIKFVWRAGGASDGQDA